MKLSKNNWTERLEKAMREAIAKARKDSVVSMSAGNLWQVTRIPQDGGPQGTNARWAARQIFNNIIAYELDIRKFVYGNLLDPDA